MMKRLIAVFLAVTILLAAVALATGCKRDEGGDGAGSANGSLGALPELVYTGRSIPLSDEWGYIDNAAVFGETIYFAVENYTVLDEDNPYLFSVSAGLYSADVSADTPAPATLAAYAPLSEKPKGTSGGVSISRIAADSEGALWIIENLSYFQPDFPEDFDFDNAQEQDLQEYILSPTASRVIRKLDSDGNEMLKIDVSELWEQDGIIFVTGFAVVGEHILLAASDGQGNSSLIYVFDAKGGSVLHRFEAGYETGGFAEMPAPGGDTVVLLPTDGAGAYESPASSLASLNLAVMAEREDVEIKGLSEEPWYRPKYYKGGGEYDILISDSAALYGYKFGEESPEELLTWLDCNVIFGYVTGVFMLPGERLVCINIAGRGTAGAELVILTKTLRQEPDDKTVLTFAGVYMANQNILTAVAEFNKSSTDYRIEVKDYMEGDIDGDWNAAYNKLTTEISAGTVPDILLLDMLPTELYAEKGLLADLYPFLDADPGLERDDIVPAALRAAEIDGGLYQAFTGFSVFTIVGNPDILGEGVGWNLDEFNAVLDKYPEADIPLGGSVRSSDFLRVIMNFEIDKYIDREAGKALFDSPEFIRLLETANRLPNEFVFSAAADFNEQQRLEAQAAADGRVLMTNLNLMGFSSINTSIFLSGNLWLRDGIVFKGFPTDGRNGHIVDVQDGVAISSSSPHRDAAWSFVRTFFEEQWQVYNTGYFPSNKVAFDKQYEGVRNGMYGGTTIYGEDGSAPIKLEPTSKEQADQMLEVISSVADSPSSGRGVDDALLSIILEDASEFFEGRVSAEAAANAIQQRASIWVSERS